MVKDADGEGGGDGEDGAGGDDEFDTDSYSNKFFSKTDICMNTWTTCTCIVVVVGVVVVVGQG